MKTYSTISIHPYNMKRFMDFLTSCQEIRTNEGYDLLLDLDSKKSIDILE